MIKLTCFTHGRTWGVVLLPNTAFLTFLQLKVTCRMLPNSALLEVRTLLEPENKH